MNAKKENPLGCGGSGEGVQGTTGRFADYSAQRASGSPWAVSNTAGFSEHGLARLQALYERVTVEHGIDPCTLAQTAAHEAGHIVVATALGDEVTGCRLFRSRAHDKLLGAQGWLGTNRRNRTLHKTDVPAFAAPTDRLIYEAMNSIAGITGEMAVGLHHPASSLDEVLAAQFACDEIAARGLGAAKAIFAHVGSTCMRIVEQNRQRFDVVRGHLEKRRRLTKEEATRMLRGVQ